MKDYDLKGKTVNELARTVNVLRMVCSDLDAIAPTALDDGARILRHNAHSQLCDLRLRLGDLLAETVGWVNEDE